MGWKSANEENKLWRQYVNNVDMNDNKWLKKIHSPIHISETHLIYSEEEFLKKLETDKEFKEKWGQLK